MTTYIHAALERNTIREHQRCGLGVGCIGWPYHRHVGTCPWGKIDLGICQASTTRNSKCEK